MQHSHQTGASSEAYQAQTGLHAQLAANENVLSTVLVDLDQQLRFRRGLLVLTDRRLLSHDALTGHWSSWSLHENDPAAGGVALSLRHFDHAGAGTLELHGGAGRLAMCRCCG